jgi:hypothetical protein
MTVENQDIEQNSDVDDIVQDNQPDEVENDDVEFTEITFNGEPLNDDDSDNEPEEEPQEDLESESVDAEQEDKAPLVNTLRKNSRQKDKYIKKLKLELEQLKKQSPKPIQSIPEPVLPRLSDYDYDDDNYQHAVNKYADDLVKYKAVQAQIESKKLSEQQFIANLQQVYIKQKSTLNFHNFDNYENVVTSNLDIEKQNIILKTDKPAFVVMTLAKNPDLLSELSYLNNEDFAYKIAKIEQNIQVNTVKKPKTKPEQLIGNAKAGMSNDKTTLEALEKEAEKTGDRSKVRAFKKQQRK